MRQRTLQPFEKFIRKKQLIPFFKHKPIVVTLCNYQYQKRSFITSFYGKRMIPITVDPKFLDINIDLNYIPNISDAISFAYKKTIGPIKITDLNHLEKIFRESLVIELGWEEKIDYKIDNNIKQENFKKISFVKLIKKYFSKKIRSLFK